MSIDHDPEETSTEELPAALIPELPALTIDDVARAVPANLKTAVTQGLIDQLNSIAADPILAEMIRTNFMSYTTVMKEGKFKLEDYLHAVKFVSYRLMGHNNKMSYGLTFPDRYRALVAKGTTEKDISAYVSAYSKNKLVNLIMEQSLVPTWVLNQDIYQEAINTQANIMRDEDVSPKVRSDAANSILTHLKKPEGKDFQLNLDVKENSGLNELKNALAAMAEKQVSNIKDGTPIKDITHSVIIEAEAKHVPDAD